MIHLGIGHAAKRELLKTLRGSHIFRIDMRLLNKDEKPVGSLTHPESRLLSGSVQIDTTATITRTLDATFLDPNDRMRFEAKSPAHGALFLDRMLRCHYEVWVPNGYGWISIPIFTGPIVSYERTGMEVELTAVGKEALLLDPYLTFDGWTIDKGTLLHDAIKRVASRQGERKFRITHLHRQRLKDPRGIHADAEPWVIINGGKKAEGMSKRVLRHAKGSKSDKDKKKWESRHSPGLVRSIKGHYECFFNGKGEMCLRKVVKRPAHKFKYGVDLATDPDQSYDQENYRNYIIVTGKKPRGKKHAPEGRAWLAPQDPTSPQRLARHGTAGRMIEHIRADHLNTDDECTKHAKEILKHRAQQGVDIAFDCLPLPMIEENDWVEVVSDSYHYEIQVKQATIPLVHDELMSIGYHKHVEPRRKKRKLKHGRYRPKKHHKHHRRHHRRHHRGRHHGRHHGGGHGRGHRRPGGHRHRHRRHGRRK